jgi:hypothetical protein
VIAIILYRVSSTTSPILSTTPYKGISLGLPFLFAMTHDKVDGSIDCCIHGCHFFLLISIDPFCIVFLDLKEPITPHVDPCMYFVHILIRLVS